MARYTGPTWKIARRLKFSILENGRELLRRPYSPGQHGKRRSKISEYGIQLQEKQKVRFVYGVNEKQFQNLFEKSAKLTGKQGHNFLFLLESRLDNLVYRLGFAGTRRQARQFVTHGHVLLDGKKADIPSILVKPGQTITLKNKMFKLDVVTEALDAVITRVPFVSYNEEQKIGTFLRYPERSEILTDIKENLIVEFYNR